MPTDIDDKTFEQSMAEMALAALKSKAPALTDYLMGFQLVERGEDDTKAMGFFAFKIGDQWVYGPTFFLNGEIKGDEMMYVKTEDKILPLNEGWINDLVKKRSFSLGGTQDSDRERLGITAPDLSRLTRRPATAKAAAARDQMLVQEIVNSIAAGTEKIAEWAEPVMDDMRRLPLTDWPQELTLPKVAAAFNLTAGLLEDCVSRPELGKSVFAFYQPQDFLDAAKEELERRSKHAAVVGPAEDKKVPVMVLDSTNVEKDRGRAAFLSVEDKQQIMRGNTVVVDGRPEEAKRKVYDYQSTMTLENPTDGGLYDMLTSDAGLRKVLILVPRVIGHGAAREVRLVIDPEANTYKFLPTLNIYVAHQYSTKEFTDALAGYGQDVSGAAFDDSANDEYDFDDGYVIVGPNGESVVPFKLTKKVEGVDGRTQLLVEPSRLELDIADRIGLERRDQNKPSAWNNQRGGSFERNMPFSGVLHDDRGILDLQSDGENRSATGPKDSWQLNRQWRILLTDKELRGPVSQGQSLHVPKKSGYRVLKVKPAKSELDPGTTADLFLGIEKAGAEGVKIYNDGLVLHITSDGGTKVARSEREALQALIADIGVDEKHARIMYKQARDLHVAEQVRYFVETQKTAAPFDSVLNSGVGSDPFLDAKVQDSLGDILVSPSEYQTRTNGDVYRHFKGENNYDQVYKKDIDRINDAAASGQKDVFDAAALGALINVHNVGDEIESYFGDLIQALDKLGRTLFLMYWHQEDVQERYGKQDLKDLEDNVKSTFESLGDVVLDLKQKSPVDVDAFGRGILSPGPKS